ncbi:MAG TPA: PocR ligand-binding domain-containing protein, partial [Bacteroidales bacterium]|nr:PocR ligand-binding domain-containing protein [Bacteroidales bacterium]
MNQLESQPEQSSSLKTSREIVKKLSSTQIYKDYEKAFSQATGLPLALKPIQSFGLAMAQSKQQNPFCAIMGRTNKSCAACLALQAELEKKAELKPASLHCFAGLCDTAVPIRVGDRLIAFLQTGQVLLHQPTREGFSKITRQLLAFGTEVDLKSLEEAYFQSKVLDEQQYKAFISLLATFAEHLGTISNSISIEASLAESETISSAKNFISSHYHEPLTLGQAAKVVNMSVRYFCKVFKESTGMT